MKTSSDGPGARRRCRRRDDRLRRQHITVLFAVAILAAVTGPSVSSSEGAASPSLGDPRWVEIAPGIEFARVEARRYCREGSPGVAVIRFDPARCRVSPYSETEFPGAELTPIGLWQDRLDVPVVFNAGLFDENRRHLGRLRRAGVDLGGQAHAAWMGLLVADPDSGGLPSAALLDLAIPEHRARADRYGTAVQSMMLFDREGKKRVRFSEKTAARTLVAEAASGHLLVLVTEGSYTLWEIADLLMESGWNMTAAMALDGGKEANLIVKSSGVRYRSSDGETLLGRRMLRVVAPLPAVIALWPDTGTVEPR